MKRNWLKYILIAAVAVVGWIFFAKWAKKKNLFKLTGNSDEQNTTQV